MSRNSHFGSLSGARVYLSGPMDFVGSREKEMKYGWRTRISWILKEMGITVFNPWEKPSVRWFYEYGRETKHVKELRRGWSFDPGKSGMKARAKCAEKFWETMHIDLRMVDLSDFVVSYCPTSVYSVGTVHEIIVAREQHKPVLLVSPRFDLASFRAFRKHLRRDKAGSALLKELLMEMPIKPNQRGVPSFWYMSLLCNNSFFDGFGFADFPAKHKWRETPLDLLERRMRPRRPLLPFLLEVHSGKLPKRFDLASGRLVADDDWLLLQVKKEAQSTKY
jgi:hypothetical protein